MSHKIFDPRRGDFTPYGFSCDKWKLTPMTRADRHNEIEMNLLTNCTFAYLVGGQRVVVPPGRLVIFWAAVPHQIIEYTRTCSYYVSTIPLAWFLEWKLPGRLTRDILAGAVVLDPVETNARHDTSLFDDWIRDIHEGDPSTHKAAVLEMEARFIRLALAYDATSQDNASSLRGHHPKELSKIEEMTTWIARHYTGNLTLSDIGNAVDLHPNYAATLFKKTFGMTINSYILAYRLAHAQRLLMVGDEKILSVALASGFNSLSRFNTAFRHHCGCTPRDYRKMHQTAQRT